MEPQILFLILAVVVIFGCLIAFSKFKRSDVSGKEKRMSLISYSGTFIILVSFILARYLDLSILFGPNYYLGYIVIGIIGFIVFVVGLFKK